MRDATNGEKRVTVGDVQRLLEQIYNEELKLREALLIPQTDPEAMRLFSEAQEVQERALAPAVLELLTDPSHQDDADWQAYARDWTAWAQIHMNTLKSLEILAGKESPSAAGAPAGAL